MKLKGSNHICFEPLASQFPSEFFSSCILSVACLYQAILFNIYVTSFYIVRGIRPLKVLGNIQITCDMEKYASLT